MKKIAALGFALLMVFAVFVPFASATAPRDYTMKVNPNPAGDGGAKETKGYLYVDLACRSPQISGEFTATPVIVSAQFTDGARVDKGFVDVYVKKVGVPQTFQFLPQGQFDTQAEPGTYLLQMENANGGQPEYILVTLNAGEKQVVQFLGHGITPYTEPEEAALPAIKILTATYGMTKLVCVPAVPAVTHQETVTDVAAYDETVVDQAAYDETVVDVPAHTVHHDAVTHVVHHAAVTHDVYTIVTGPGQFTGYAKEQSNNVDFIVNGHKYHIVGSSGYGTVKYLKTTVVDQAAYDETVVDQAAYDEFVPAVTHVVHHDAVTHVVHHPAQTHTITVVDTPAIPGSVHLEGSFKNVKAQVQSAVDAGYRTFKFDNAASPGGLFDGEGNLLAAITDPAPGQVKKFVITYKVNGHIKVAAGDEYEEFILG